MLASYRWLQQLLSVDTSVEELAERMSVAGLEVEALHVKGDQLNDVVVAEVRAKKAHPKRDKLSLVTVFDGEVEHEVVCGASNVPEAGGRVLFARLGAALPNGMQIEERKVGGVVSRGMICSEAELDIGADVDGIFVFGDEPGAAGDAAVDALNLRDTVLEIGLTPNRPDCLGHLGIAREIAVLLGLDFTPKRGGLLSDSGDVPVTVEIADGDRCPRYGAALVRGVTVGPSPFWLRYRLHNLGVRALSNVVDATNHILFEFGHPIHGFDLNHVRDAKISVRLANDGETLTTLDGVERALTPDDLLICDGQGPVALAGIMGGENSEIRDNTRDVLIECAYFDPRSVRRTSRRLGLHTDSSHRFERGVDPNQVPWVLSRAATMVAQLGGGTVHAHAIDNVAKKITPVTTTLRHRRVASLLGMSVPSEDTRTILKHVGCTISEETADAITVQAPTWRPDLGREVDLIEEVARVRGYDSIPTQMPRVRPTAGDGRAEVDFVDRLRRAAAASGLHEAITYSFVSESDLARAKTPPAEVKLANPLSEERSVMRTSLLPGLLQAAGRAQRHGADQVRLFEIGRVFGAVGETLPDEQLRLALILAGERSSWIGTDGPFDFYDGKGATEAVLRHLVRKPLRFRPVEPPAWLHPKRSAGVELSDLHVGTVGELHPDVVEAAGLTTRAVFASLAISPLWQSVRDLGAPQVSGLPRFPSVSRDLALWLADRFSAEEVASALREAAGGLAESVALFDLYRDNTAHPDARSLAFRVVYRDPQETLTDKRVDKVHQKLGKMVKDRFDATVR